MSSPHRLSEAALALTEHNNRKVTHPPAVAAVNPLIELLIHEVQIHVPEQIRARLAVAGDSSAALDWIGVARLFEALPPGADRKGFLAALGDDPGRLFPAWIATMGAYCPPPKPTDRQKLCDVAGVVLQLGVIALLLAMRCALSGLLAAPLDLPKPVRHLAGLVYLPLLARAAARWSMPFWGLLAACLWSIAEATLGPRVMEAVRRKPFRDAREKLLAPGRVDIFCLLWSAQAVILLAACVWRLVAR